MPPDSPGVLQTHPEVHGRLCVCVCVRTVCYAFNVMPNGETHYFQQTPGVSEELCVNVWIVIILIGPSAGWEIPG